MKQALLAEWAAVALLVVAGALRRLQTVEPVAPASADRTARTSEQHAAAEPECWRDVNSNGESEAVVWGLAAGRFAVRSSSVMDRQRTKRHDLQLDGSSEVILDSAP